MAGRVFISNKQQFSQNQTMDTSLVHRSSCIRHQQHHLDDRQVLTPLSSQCLRHASWRQFTSLRLFRLSVMRKERTILFVGGRNGEFFAYVGCCLLNGLWHTRDQYGKLWVPDRYKAPIRIPGVDDYFYFYLNVRSMSQGGKFSLY